jgi:hypothetical protein
MNKLSIVKRDPWVVLSRSWVLVMFCIFCSMQSSNVSAYSTEFHGYLESNLILRDTNGFQYGFFDKGEAIQQRNTLKFDVDIMPGLTFGTEANTFSVEKVHLTYRGAVDSIFTLRDKDYDVIRTTGPSRFELGRDDIAYENDLREATVDLTYEGTAGKSFLRLGRQMVSWGEALGVTITDVINPPDNSFQMFFLNPDELKIPLWMARYNHSVRVSPSLGINGDFVVVPDVRPQQFAPLDSSMAAPYAFVFAGLKGLNVREEVDTRQVQWGGRIKFELGTNSNIALSYFEGINAGPAIELRDLVFIGGIPYPTTAVFTHPWIKTYGGSFDTYVGLLDVVVRGEFGLIKGSPVSLPATAPDFILSSMSMRTYRLKDVGKAMLAVDKNVWAKWLSDSQVNLSLQWVHNHIYDWEPVYDASATKEDIDLPLLMISWNNFHGQLAPSLMAMYDTQGTCMTQVSAKWSITSAWYVSLALQAFWGDTTAKSDFAPLIGTSEATIKVGYQF